jgi:hypothetical protein
VDGLVEVERSPRVLVRNGLFVMGSPRSGTTILQNALNDSPDVFLFGEADFHADPDTPDFARRYNEMHRLWRNQATKSTFCPTLFDGDARWSDYLARLAQHYRLVGSKIVFNPSTFLHDPEQVLNFYSREFYSSHFIFTFRNPLQMAQSAREFQLMTGGEVTPFDMLMSSYIAVVSLCIVMLRNLPHVHIVFHDNMSRRVFGDLGRKLGVRLSGARRYYDRGRVREYDPTPMLEAHGEKARLALDLYRDFREAAIHGFDLVQIEQNSGDITPNHLTPLGQLARRCETISEGLEHGKAVVAR